MAWYDYKKRLANAKNKKGIKRKSLKFICIYIFYSSVHELEQKYLLRGKINREKQKVNYLAKKLPSNFHLLTKYLF